MKNCLVGNKVPTDFVDKPSTKQSWAFTCKKLGTIEPTREDYTVVVDRFLNYGFISNLVEEKDPSGRLHIHGTIQLRKGFLRKRLIVKGFHLKLVEIFDQKGWDAYCSKDTVPFLFDRQYEVAEVEDSD